MLRGKVNMNSDGTTPKSSVDDTDRGTHSAALGNAEKPVCFVIMPISDHPEYETGHFKRVFEDIFQPACDKAGFRAVRADQVGQTNLIHLDVLQKLLASPMVLCDLSSRNPNVLFELGLRQAFDKPVVLVREIGTPDIFDIAPIRYIEYRKKRIYNEVLQDQKHIADAIAATQEAFESGEGVNSIVRLLSITQPATLPDVREAEKDPVLQIVRAELAELRTEFREALKTKELTSRSRRSIVTEEIPQRELRILRSLVSAIEDLVARSRNGSIAPDTFPEMLESANKRVRLLVDQTDRSDTLRDLVTIERRLGKAKAEYDLLVADNEDIDLNEEDFEDIPF